MFTPILYLHFLAFALIEQGHEEVMASHGMVLVAVSGWEIL